jgi:hypothetical protein
MRNGPEGSKVDLLASRLVGIVRPPAHSGCEVLDPVNCVVREEKLAEPPDVEPLVRSILDGTIVEIEAVNIDPRPWTHVAAY